MDMTRYSQSNTASQPKNGSLVHIVTVYEKEIYHYLAIYEEGGFFELTSQEHIELGDLEIWWNYEPEVPQYLIDLCK